MRKFVIFMILSSLLFSVTGCSLFGDDDDNPVAATTTARVFTVTLNVLSTSPTPLSPGVFVIHKAGMPIFTNGKPDRGIGLEAQAEDGDPSGLAVTTGGTIFNIPVGDTAAGPATPGKQFQFTFSASPGDHLSFATMYGQSNDGFFAPADTGLALFTGSTPVTGDVTSSIYLWDAGTEVNQTPGTGADQAPRQAAPNTGASESANVDLISNKDAFNYGTVLSATIQVQ